MPAEAADAMEELVGEITGETRPGVLSVGIVVTLWAASWGLHALSMGLDRAWGAAVRRRWLIHRILAMGMLAGILVLLIAGTLVLISGPQVLRWIGLQELWFVLRWPAAFGLIVVVLWLIYFFSSHTEERPGKGPVFLGAVTATTIWLAATAGFRLYVSTFGAIGRTYGLVAGILILLFWLYLTSLSLLLGAKVAAVCEERRRARRPGAEDAEVAVSAPPSPS
jgi:membrane protein